MSQPKAPPKNENEGKELEALLLSIQRDPKSAAAALPKLSKDELLSLFALFIDTDDETSSKNSNLRSSAYLALSSFVGTVRHPSSTNEPEVQNVDPERQNEATVTLARAFYPTVEDVLRGSNVSHIIATSAFLSALFQVDAPSASLIFTREGNLECILDATDLAQEIGRATGKRQDGRGQLELALAVLLSHATGQTECRKLLDGETSSLGGKGMSWLGQIAEASKDSRVKASAALALVKFMQGRIQDTENAQSGIPAAAETSGITEITNGGVSSVDGLAALLENIIITSTTTTEPSSTTGAGSPSPAVATNQKTVREAVEGLAYLSVHPSIREYITSQPKLLKSLFAAGLQSTKKTKPSTSISSSRLPEKDGIPITSPDDHRLNIGLHYGLALTLANLCQYRPKLSKEEEQIARLRRMTKPAAETSSSGGGVRTTMGAQDEGDDPRTSDPAVRTRVKKLCRAGMLPLLAGLARSESRSARECTSRVYLYVVEDQTNRGEVLKDGGSRALLDIIKSHPSSSSSSSSPPKGGNDVPLLIPDWNAIQALSKLAITASPLQVFGPNVGVTFDAIPPLCSVITFADLVSSSSNPLKGGSSVPENRLPTSLQRFEALMALTNIASMGPEVAERIAKTKGVSIALENGLLDEHEMLRRANVELLCNLVVCEPVFDRFVPRPGDGGGAAESRLQILVALADVDDLQTRKAASGALAVLSSDERVCSGFVALQKKRGSLLRIFRRLLVDEEEEEEEDDEPEPEEEAPGATSKVKKEEKGRRRSKRGESPIADFDLVHRGVFIFRNLAVLFVEKRKSGVKEFMASLAEEEIVSVVERVVKEGIRRQKEGGPDVVAATRPVLENALEFVIALRNASQVLE